MVNIVVLQDTLNPISAQERVKINENWDALRRGFSSLQNQINFLSGGTEVDVIVARIEQAIQDAQTNTQNAIDNVNNNYAEKLTEINQSLTDLSNALTNAQTATNEANAARDNATNATTAALESINQIQSLISNFSPRGDFVLGTQYYKSNIVSDGNGSSYIAVQDNINSPLTNTNNWMLLASVGRQGIQGEKGETGSGFEVKGYFLTLQDLENAIDSPQAGDAYGVGTSQPYDIYIYDGINELWVNNGALQGAKGERGETGPQGEPGQQGEPGISQEPYILPTANETTLGGVKIDGTTIVIDENGVISSVGGGSTTSKIYGVRIDTTNSNPDTALSYTDDAIGLNPAKGNNGNFDYGGWADKFPFNQIKPCLFLNGNVVGYLNPNDYTKFENGEAADITSGNSGDVMIEFPKVYWRFERVGSHLFIKYSNNRVDNSFFPFEPLAHQKGNSEKDFVYISAYLGSTLSSRLRSLSDKVPTVNLNLSDFRNLARSNGENYEQSCYYQTLMLQVLFIVMFKNRDSQVALGKGYTNGTSIVKTGGTDKKGMFYGEDTGTLQNKFCGIEDFWGNLSTFADGLLVDSEFNLLLSNQNFNDNGVGYVNFGKMTTATINGYTLDVQGGTNSGFIIKDSGGSATTYYTDEGSVLESRIIRFGGAFNSSQSGGVFNVSITGRPESPYGTVGSRLIYL